jgi:hypothetical protein
MDSEAYNITLIVILGCVILFGMLYGALSPHLKKYPCCPFCKEIIDPKAKRCPHCTSQL